MVQSGMRRMVLLILVPMGMPLVSVLVVRVPSLE